MKPFIFHNPVKLVWGEGTIKEISQLIPKNSKVLLLYGGGSIKRNGVYSQASSALNGYEWDEFGGIEANPSYETSLQVVKKIVDGGYNFLLAVGGGSVIDTAKFSALASCVTEDMDPWGVMTGAVAPFKAIPLGTVLTLPATGSEMNANFVISRKKTMEKLVNSNPLVFPVFSIMDPTTTVSLGPRQTANGIVDSFIHVLEQYLTIDEDTPVQDSWAEGILFTLIETGPSLMSDLGNVKLRNRLMYCATMALNGFISMGCSEDWATHRIGHEITALYGLDHARSLSSILGTLLRYRKKIKSSKLSMFARRVWKLQEEDDDLLIEEAISRMESFFSSLGVPVSLTEAKIPVEAAAIVANRFRDSKTTLGEDGGIGPEDIEAILNKAF